ncbi:hypothetical protein L209DRAFT_323060 [Thermothelomyces heterothallicus CBS 203.75]
MWYYVETKTRRRSGSTLRGADDDDGTGLARVWLEFVLVNPLTHQEETKTPRRSNRSLYRAAWPVRTVLVSSTDAQSTTPGLLFYRFQESLQGQCSRNSDLFFPYALPFTSSHFHHHVFPILFLVVLGVVIKSYLEKL